MEGTWRKKSAQYRLIGMQAETQCSLDRKSNEEKLTNSGLDTIANQKLVFSERICRVWSWNLIKLSMIYTVWSKEFYRDLWLLRSGIHRQWRRAYIVPWISRKELSDVRAVRNIYRWWSGRPYIHNMSSALHSFHGRVSAVIYPARIKMRFLSSMFQMLFMIF